MSSRERHRPSDHRRFDWFLNVLYWLTKIESSTSPVLYEENPSASCGFSSQRTNNVKAFPCHGVIMGQKGCNNVTVLLFCRSLDARLQSLSQDDKTFSIIAEKHWPLTGDAIILDIVFERYFLMLNQILRVYPHYSNYNTYNELHIIIRWLSDNARLVANFVDFM